MKRTIWLWIGLLGVTTLGMQSFGDDGLAAPGTAYSSDYTFDGTLEPDDIPGMADSSDYFNGKTSDSGEVFAADAVAISAGGPVRLPKSVLMRSKQSRNENDDLLATVVAELKLSPPKQVRARASYFEPNGKYALVQYKSQGTRKPRSRVVEEPRPEVRERASVQESGPQREPEHPESLKRSLRSTLVANSRRAVTTQHNSPGDILLMALPYGADARVWQSNPETNSRDKSASKGSYIYSIGTLCWNYACGGKSLLRTDGKRVYARVGAGYQRRPASFLALLAMSNIMPDYQMKVDGSGVFSIKDLVATEKASVSKGMNLSMALVGLSFYAAANESWKNEMGETWNIERMVIEELNRSIDQGSSDVTDWLLGLTAAVNLYEEEGRALRGPMALAKKQLGVYHEFVLSVQNENYLWHPKFFMFRGISADAYETLYSGGHILRWLVLSLSDEQLEDVRVRRAVANLNAAINRIPVNTPAGTLTDRQLEGIAVSLQALAVYHQRAFGNELIEERPADKEQSVARAR